MRLRFEKYILKYCEVMKVDSTTIAAIIGGAAAIIAAIIGGLFVILKRDKKETPTQSATAGGHAIIASGKATQSINFGPQSPPPPHKLIALAEQIRDRTNKSVFENERALYPVIRDPSLRHSVGNDMAKLFEEQKDRAAFGEWEVVLQNALDQETNPQVRGAIEDLLSCVQRLYQAFYSYYESVEDKGEFETKKHFVELVLGNRGSDPAWRQLSHEEIITIARDYLDFLRYTVEEIGRAIGQLRSSL